MRPLMRKRLHYDWHWDFNTGNGDVGNQGKTALQPRAKHPYKIDATVPAERTDRSINDRRRTASARNRLEMVRSTKQGIVPPDVDLL